ASRSRRRNQSAPFEGPVYRSVPTIQRRFSAAPTAYAHAPMGGTKRRVVHVAAALLAVALLAACEPPRPSAGRGTPVRRVFLLGDSITHGLYGTTPRIHGLLDQRLRQRGIQLSIGGFPGENPLWVWPGHPSWLEVLRERVRNFDPDMIIIQSTLFPEVGDPAKHDLYLRTVRQMLDVAQSRGAHVYSVHHRPPPARHPEQRIALAVCAQLLGQDGADRGRVGCQLQPCVSLR